MIVQNLHIVDACYEYARNVTGAKVSTYMYAPQINTIWLYHLLNGLLEKSWVLYIWWYWVFCELITVFIRNEK